jgi:imidazolonepropionase-like amidohydrolase
VKKAPISAALAIIAFGAALAPAAEPAPKPTVAIRAGRLLDVKSGRYVDHPVIVVAGDRIESIGTAVPAGATVIELGDRVLMPGLIDAHTHIFLQGDATSAEYDEQILREYPAHRVVRAVRAMQIGLGHGFTTMRDVETEGAGYDDEAIRDAVN